MLTHGYAQAQTPKDVRNRDARAQTEAGDSSVLDLVGNTPLLQLRRILPGAHFELYVKLEGFNPGGSIKDRSALNILKSALAEGKISRDSVIIESSSGNMAVGLAQAARIFGMRFIAVVDPHATRANLALIRALGGELHEVTQPDPVSGEFLAARRRTVRQLLATIPRSYSPNQYSNRRNSDAHHATMSEIATALNGRVDHVFCATSSCGTLRGCAEYIRDHGLSTRLHAVDAAGSILFNPTRSRRLIPGHGAGVRPQLLAPGLADDVVWVSDLDCVVGCRRLAMREALLVGGSSGGVLMAVQRSVFGIRANQVCVAIVADRGERYVDTIYSDEWVERTFGDVSHLWSDAGVSRE